MGEIWTCREVRAKLLQCRINIKIATFNVKTLVIREVYKVLHKTEDMTSNMRKYNISICHIQEHRKVQSADREQEINPYDVDPGYDLYTVSSWRN